MNELARDFAQKHGDTIICEPSGRTLTELWEDKVQVFRLMTQIPRNKITKKKIKKRLSNGVKLKGKYDEKM